MMTKPGTDQKQRNPFRLSRLRDIGWKHWDPIGLLDAGADWSELSYADEYDSYLLRAAGMISNGQEDCAVADYLASVETDRMGMNRPDGDELADRTLRVATALREYVEDELPRQGTNHPKTVML